MRRDFFFVGNKNTRKDEKGATTKKKTGERKTEEVPAAEQEKR